MKNDELLKVGTVFAVVLVLAALGNTGLLPAFTAWIAKVITAGLVSG